LAAELRPKQPAGTLAHRGLGVRRSQRFVLVFFQVYLIGSVVAFAFGPTDYDPVNPATFYTYVLGGQLAIVFGYSLGTSRPARGYRGPISIEIVQKASITAVLLLLPITLTYRNYAALSLTQALADPGTAYAARLDSFYGGETTPLLSIVRGFLAPLMKLFLPLGIVYWQRLTPLWKRLWLAGLVGLFVEAIFTGAAIGVFDLILVIPWMLWLGLRQRRWARKPVSAWPLQPYANAQNHRLPKRGLLALLTVILLGAGTLYFSYSRQSRYGLAGNEYPPWTTGWSQDRYGVSLPASIEYPLYTLATYWTQGYQGLSECLDLPFEWCYLCGHSSFWSRYAERLWSHPYGIQSRSYPHRLEAETRYSATNNWHTIYPWLASDLTFFGAAVFVGLLAYLLARALTDSLVAKNPFAVGFLGQILMLFYYIPANNGRLSYPEETMAFWGLLLLWLLTAKRGA
jgi:hypothetical protein